VVGYRRIRSGIFSPFRHEIFTTDSQPILQWGHAEKGLFTVEIFSVRTCERRCRNCDCPTCSGVTSGITRPRSVST